MTETFLFVHNNTPESWTTRQDMQIALAQAVVDQGHRAILTFTGPPVDPVAQRLRSCGCEIDICNPEAPPWRLRRELQSLVHRYRPSVLQTRFCSHASPIHLVAKSLGVPHVVYVQATSGSVTRRPLKRALLGLRAKTMLSGADHIIAISQYVRRELMELGVSPEKIAVVANGIDCAGYRSAPPSGAPAVASIATASYLVPRKRLHVLLSACGILLRQGVEFQFTLAGGGPLNDELREQATRLGLNGCVTFAGWIDDAAEIMRGCDIFIMASIGEAFGNVAIEAMASGRPVVAPASGAFPELITHGSDGLLYRPLDAADLAAKLLRVIEDRALLQRMGYAAAFSSTRYDLLHFVNGIARFYWSRFGIEIGLRRESASAFRRCTLNPQVCPYVAAS
jgi:glycosyltransferase involved in cell wall biosynthesis